MKIVLFGATGTIGQRILNEALDRGHEVTAVVRDVSGISDKENLRLAKGDVTKAESVAEVVAGHDAVISAVGPGANSVELVVDAAHALIAGLNRAGVKRLVTVGGAGSLEVAPGVQLIDTPEFPEAWKTIAQAHSDALKVFQADTSLDWTSISPAAFIEPGTRTGKYRTGGDQLIMDDKGESRISAEDYAAALIDEVENPQHIQKRMTVAY